MSGTLAPVYALVTTLTALLVATVLAPVLRLMLEPGIVLPRRLPARTPAAAGSLSVLVAAAVLLPMGGDGLLVPFTDTPIAFGLFSAFLLFLVGSSRVYGSFPVYGRVGLQAAVAFLAVVGGVHAQTGPLATYALPAIVLLVAMNAIEALSRTRGLAVGSAAVVAGFLACVAGAFEEPGLSDLNLGLCGALFALLGFRVVRRIGMRVELCAGGRLAVGFLIGMSYLRLTAHAVPEARIWMLFPMSIPVAVLALTVLAAALRPLARRLRVPNPEVRSSLGLTSAHLLVLCLLANALIALAALRLLGIF